MSTCSGAKTSATETSSVAGTPRRLVVGLGRTLWNGSLQQHDKLHTRVEPDVRFWSALPPEDSMYLQERLVFNGAEYLLEAALLHQGSTWAGGHYTLRYTDHRRHRSFAQAPASHNNLSHSSEHYRINDSVVTQIDGAACAADRQACGVLYTYARRDVLGKVCTAAPRRNTAL